MAAHAFNPSTREAGAGGSLSSKPGWSPVHCRTVRELHNGETLSQKHSKQTNSMCRCCWEDRDEGLEGKARVLAHKPDSLASFFRTHVMEGENRLPSSLASSLTCAHASFPPWNKYMIKHLRYHQFPLSSSLFRGRFLLSWVCVVCLCCSSNKNCPSSLSATLTWVSYGTEFTVRNLSTLPGSTGRTASRLGKLLPGSRLGRAVLRFESTQEAFKSKLKI